MALQPRVSNSVNTPGQRSQMSTLLSTESNSIQSEKERLAKTVMRKKRPKSTIGRLAEVLHPEVKSEEEIQLEQRIQHYLSVCRKCDKCEIFFGDIQQALDCLKSHGLKRCFGCFKAVKNNKIFLIDHFSEFHYDPECPAFIKCPFCNLPQSQHRNELEQHVIQTHSEELLLSVIVGGGTINALSSKKSQNQNNLCSKWVDQTPVENQGVERGETWNCRSKNNTFIIGSKSVRTLTRSYADMVEPEPEPINIKPGVSKLNGGAVLEFEDTVKKVDLPTSYEIESPKRLKREPRKASLMAIVKLQEWNAVCKNGSEFDLGEEFEDLKESRTMMREKLDQDKLENQLIQKCNILNEPETLRPPKDPCDSMEKETNVQTHVAKYTVPMMGKDSHSNPEVPNQNDFFPLPSPKRESPPNDDKKLPGSENIPPPVNKDNLPSTLDLDKSKPEDKNSVTIASKISQFITKLMADYRLPEKVPESAPNLNSQKQLECSENHNIEKEPIHQNSDSNLSTVEKHAEIPTTELKSELKSEPEVGGGDTDIPNPIPLHEFLKVQIDEDVSDFPPQADPMDVYDFVDSPHEPQSNSPGQNLFQDTIPLPPYSKSHPAVISCETCGKNFKLSALADAYRFRVHQNIHEGIWPFICKICPTVFERSTNFREHALKCHNIVVPPFKGNRWQVPQVRVLELQ